MKGRHLLALGALAAALSPVAARATHCDTPIFVFSQTRVQTDIPDPTTPGGTIGRTLPSVTSSAIGCTVVRDTVVGGEDPNAHPLMDTDIIYPASNRLSVRFLEHGTDPTIIATATLTYAGTVYPLTMNPGSAVAGAATWLDSDPLTIDPATTVVPNTAVADICLTTGECFSRTYRTVPTA